MEVWDEPNFVRLRLDLLESLVRFRLDHVVHLGWMCLHLVEIDVNLRKFKIRNHHGFAFSGEGCDLDFFIVDLSPLLYKLALWLLPLTFQHRILHDLRVLRGVLLIAYVDLRRYFLLTLGILFIFK